LLVHLGLSVYPPQKKIGTSKVFLPCPIPSQLHQCKCRQWQQQRPCESRHVTRVDSGELRWSVSRFHHGTCKIRNLNQFGRPSLTHDINVV
jgi:hypothetical protein